jgi:hypothetical protein
VANSGGRPDWSGPCNGPTDALAEETVVAVVAQIRGAAYGDPEYARSLVEHGRLCALPGCGGWLLMRSVPGGGRRHDAMGCYPLFQCRDWRALPEDLEELAEMADAPVAVNLVADPLGDHDPELLGRAFPDVARPFKEHYLVDLAQDPAAFVHPHNRRNARKAARHFQVEICAHPLEHLDEWLRLYRALCKRHGITGLAAFSREAFKHQLAVPRAVLMRATDGGGDTVAMLLWYVRDDQAWYHLGASDERGYRHGGAANTLMWESFEHFRRQGMTRLNLGGASGIAPRLDDGLARFKAGWSNERAAAWFCGRVLDRDAYDILTARADALGSCYFPAYRTGEFL